MRAGPPRASPRGCDSPPSDTPARDLGIRPVVYGQAVWLSGDRTGAYENAADEGHDLEGQGFTIFELNLPNTFIVEDIHYSPEFEEGIDSEVFLDELTYKGHIPPKYITVYERI